MDLIEFTSGRFTNIHIPVNGVASNSSTSLQIYTTHSVCLGDPLKRLRLSTMLMQT